MVFVLTVHEDADDASLSDSHDQILRIHGLGWSIPAVFVNVLEGSKRERWEDSLLLWTRVAESLRNLCQPVYAIAAEGLSLPGLLVLDACDYVVASKLHAGTLVNRVAPRHLIGDTCQELFNDVIGSSLPRLKAKKVKLSRQKILDRLPKPPRKRPQLQRSNSSPTTPRRPCQTDPNSASTRASLSPTNTDSRKGLKRSVMRLAGSTPGDLQELILNGLPVSV